MRALIIATISLAAGLHAQDSRRIDVKNLFPNVGTMIVWADPNDAGVPSGVLGACSGTLIHEQIFLTAGHCTRGAVEGDIAPFIHFFVTFNLHAFDDNSTWIPVMAQTWHPTTLPCPNHVCNWPEPPFPGMSEVGLVFFAEPVKLTEPATLAPVGSLQGRPENEEHVIVGYGFPDSRPRGGMPPWTQWEGVRYYRVIRPEQIFDDRQAIGGTGENCFGDSGGPTFLGPPGESGGRQRAIVATTSAFVGGAGICSASRSIVTRIDNADVQSWIAEQVEEFVATRR